MLPTVQYPTFTLTTPCTKQDIKFRQFTLREHKLILQTYEMGDVIQHANTLCDVINSCAFDKIESRNFPSSTIDYLFLMLRAKSKADLVPIVYTCLKPTGKKIIDSNTQEEIDEVCNTQIKYHINLNDVQVITPEDFNKKKIVYVTDDIVIKFKEPNFVNSNVNKSIEKEDKNEIFYVSEDFMFLCVESIADKDNVSIPNQDFTLDEFISFLQTIPQSAIDSINDFFTNLPYINLKAKVKCTNPKCNNEKEIDITNLESFLD